jgi:hypothetical protein
MRTPTTTLLPDAPRALPGVVRRPPGDAKPRFLAKSSLRREYRNGAPVTASGEICAVTDADGTLSVFAVGTDGDVYWLDELPSGHWKTTCLEVKKAVPWISAVNTIDVHVDPDGTRSIALTVLSGTIESATVLYMREQPMNSTWQKLSWTTDPNDGTVDAWFGPSPSGNETVLYANGYMRGTTKCYLNMWSNLAKNPTNSHPDWLRFGWGEPLRRRYRGVGKLGGKPAVFANAVNAGGGAYSETSALPTRAQGDVIPNRILVSSNAADAGYTHALAVDDPQNPDYSAVLCAMGPTFEDYAHPGPRTGMRRLCLIRQTPQGRQTTEIVEDHGALYSLSRRRCLSYLGRKLDQKDPDARAIGFELFTYAEKEKTLVHLTEDFASHAWSKPISLLKPTSASSFAVCPGRDGSPVVFALRADGKMVKMTRNESGGWLTREIVLEGTDRLMEYQAYVTEVTLVDAHDIAMGGVEVTLRSNHAPNELIVNHQAMVVDSQGVKVRTDARGVLLISDEVDTIATYVTHLTADGVEPLALDPVKPIYDKLEDLSRDASPERLRDARVEQTDGTTKPLLDHYDEKSADAAVNGIKQSLTMAVRTSSSLRGSVGTGAIHAHSDPVLFHVGHHERHHDFDLIAVNKVPEQHWSLRYDPATRQLDYQDLTAEEALGRFHALRDGPPSLFSAWSWGDVFQSLWSGITHVVEIVVSKVAEGIKAVITIGEQIWSGIIHAVEQAYDVVRFVFQAIGAALEKVWQFVGFVFNWTDILLVRDGFRAALEEGLDALANVAGQIDRAVSGAGKEGRARIKAAFDDIIDHQVKAKSMADMADATPPIDPKLKAGSENNVFAQGIEAGAREKNVRIAASSEPKLQAVLQDARWDHLVERIKDLENLDEFKKVGAFLHSALDRLKDNPRAFLQEGLVALLELVSGLLQAAVQIAVDVVHFIAELVGTVVDAFRDFVTNTELDIPLVKDLYEQISDGHKLTVIDLAALAMAIPASIACKLIRKEPLFKDKTAVKEFRGVLAFLKGEPRAAVGNASTEPYFSAGAQLAGLLMTAVGGAGSLVMSIIGDLFDCNEPDFFTKTGARIAGGIQFLFDLAAWIGNCLLDATKGWAQVDWNAWKCGFITPVLDFLGVVALGGSTVFVSKANRLLLLGGAIGTVVTFVMICMQKASTNTPWNAVDVVAVVGLLPAFPRLGRMGVAAMEPASRECLAIGLVIFDLLCGAAAIAVPIVSQAKRSSFLTGATMELPPLAIPAAV